ncbi:MAG: Re/Si-specific NAD(P)(+) transhydrogenase subunit alpha, partial [Leptospiraceae bacterium]|nr:Re/Si-specific NAD(P)(+) transhydrogenase subunit alpha [Leptospiraceae bacterium]
MILGVPKEIIEGEKRVGIVPESLAKLTSLGFEIRVQKDAGREAGFLDSDYEAHGAKIVPNAGDLYGQSDVIVKVERPADHPEAGKHELELMKKGALLVCFMAPLNFPEVSKKAAELGVDALSMNDIPRITRAQRMDALSSQTNLAGYKAVLMGANALRKIFPLLMTAAGTISPAKVVILGAGVAGLQAIATARRLGAVVEVSDVRPAVKEQVESLGGKYIEPPQDETLEGEGGYAKEASEEYLKKQQELLKKHISEADVVVTTAQVPGKKAPVLISEETVQSMRPGSVIVDMAAGTGGNCAITEAGQVVEKHGVTIIGETNIVSLVAFNASQLYSRN